MQNLAKFIATGAYSGYFPKAPGTAGSLVAVFIVFLLYETIGVWESAINFQTWLVILIFLATLGALWSISELEPLWGKDPSKVVIDEWIGMWISVLFIPFSWVHLVISFILFRIFDIWKPFGIHLAERLKGAKGVILDDVLAGIAANICLQVLLLIKQGIE